VLALIAERTLRYLSFLLMAIDLYIQDAANMSADVSLAL